MIPSRNDLSLSLSLRKDLSKRPLSLLETISLSLWKRPLWKRPLSRNDLSLSLFILRSVSQRALHPSFTAICPSLWSLYVSLVLLMHLQLRQQAIELIFAIADQRIGLILSSRAGCHVYCCSMSVRQRCW